MSVEGGDIVWRILGDDKGLADAVGNATKDAQERFGQMSRTIGVAMTALGGAITGGLVGSAVAWANMGSEIKDVSDRMGWATEAVSEFKFMADQSGTSLQTVEVAAKKLAMGMTEAGRQGAEATGGFNESLQMIGLTYEELAAQSPEQQFMSVAMGLASLEDHTIKVGLAQEFFGRSGADLIPLLDQGAAGIQQMRDRAAELGLVFSEEAAGKAEAFGDTLDQLKMSFQGIIIQIGPIVADLMDRFIPGIIKTVSSIADWISENSRLATSIIVAAAAAGGLMLTLGPFLMVLPGLISLVSGLSGVLAGGSGLAAAASVCGSSVFGLAGSLAGPVGLAAAIAGTIVLIGQAISKFNELRAAQDNERTSIDNMRYTTEQQIEVLRQHGVEVDELRVRQMGLTEANEYLSGLVRETIAKERADREAMGESAEQTFDGIALSAEVNADATASAWESSAARINQAMASIGAANSYVPPQAAEYPGMAEGGTVSSAGMVMVGERGPELLNLPKGAKVTPNNQLPASGGGNISINFTGPMNVRNDQDIDALSRRLAANVARGLRSAGYAV